MRIRLDWESIQMEWSHKENKEVISKWDKKSIFLRVSIVGLSEEKSYKFQDELEKAINERLSGLYGKASFSQAIGYGVTGDNVLSDIIDWERDHGHVAEQKKDIEKTIRRICKEIKGRYQ